MTTTFSVLACLILFVAGTAFGLRRQSSLSSRPFGKRLRCSENEAPSDSSAGFEVVGAVVSSAVPTQALWAVKTQLVSTAAACDRGFGASRADRDRVEALLDQLVALNPPQQAATKGIFPAVDVDAPLEGVWKLIYTDAYDVLSLAASPLTLLQGIYQVIERSGRSCNVIDITSRIVPLLPVPLATRLESVLRLKVFTESSARSDVRVGLRFMSVAVQPLSLLGQKLTVPGLSASLPQKFLYELVDSAVAAFSGSSSSTPSASSSTEESINALGYFDVVYLDDDLLVIKQNQPGGMFISSRVRDAGDVASFF